MIQKTAMSRGWTAALAAAILGAVLALAALGSAGAQSASDVTVGSGTVEPGGSITIDVSANASGVGAYRVDVQYDSTLVTATDCTSAFGICSIDTVAASTVRINGSSVSGISGNPVVLGTITFTAGQTEGTADLNVDSGTFLFSDTSGSDISVTPTGGEIVIAQATPTPTPAPTTPGATAAPTATPGGLPATGGPDAESTASTMAWLLAAAGVVVVSAGAWALARARREN
jgi:hypothetical protein